MICKYLLLIALICEKAHIDVELDLSFKDTTVQYQYLYVVCSNQNDTLAIFDTLSFNKYNRVSLFYSVNNKGKNKLSMTDYNGKQYESKPFMVSPYNTLFSVVVGQQQISVAKKDFLYTKKNENKKSYYVFLLIYLMVKVLITAIYVFIAKLPKRNISIALGAFLISSFIDWYFPVYYLYRLLMIMLIEYLFIAFVGRKSISWLHTMFLVLFVNISGFGIIAILYLFYLFV